MVLTLFCKAKQMTLLNLSVCSQINGTVAHAVNPTYQYRYVFLCNIRSFQTTTVFKVIAIRLGLSAACHSTASHECHLSS